MVMHVKSPLGQQRAGKVGGSVGERVKKANKMNFCCCLAHDRHHFANELSSAHVPCAMLLGGVTK
eukprot:6027090-Amphidinium_carterae.1